MKISKIRNWLNKNKVFFEVIVAFSLSFMAIFLSIQANRIAKAQTKIMEEENLPQIEIRSTQEYNEQKKLYDNDIWLFFNRGGKIADFDVTNYSLYRFTYRPNYDTLIFPIYSYMNYRGVLTGESEGLIYQIDNDHNGAKEIELRDSLSNYGFYGIDTYAKLTYKDIFNKPHSEFYQINPSKKSITKEHWEEIEKQFSDVSKTIYFKKLFAINIIDSIVHNSR
jgi:hypothetical protein